MKTREHRYKVLNINCETIAGIFVDGNHNIIDRLRYECDIPRDVEYIRCYQSITTDSDGNTYLAQYVSPLSRSSLSSLLS